MHRGYGVIDVDSDIPETVEDAALAGMEKLKGTTDGEGQYNTASV